MLKTDYKRGVGRVLYSTSHVAEQKKDDSDRRMEYGLQHLHQRGELEDLLPRAPTGFKEQYNNTDVPTQYRMPKQNKENLKYEFLLSVVDETGLLKDDLQLKTKVWTRERGLEYFDKEVEQTEVDSKK